MSGWLVVGAVLYPSEKMNNPESINPVISLVGMVLLIFGPGLILGLVTGVGMRWILKPDVRTN